jgi:hypothetical protein
MQQPSGRWIPRSVSIDSAPIVHNSDLPLLMCFGTVAVQCSLQSKCHKQMKNKRIGVEWRRNFVIWCRIDEEFRDWRLVCSWAKWREWEVSRSVLGNCDIQLWLGDDFDYIWMLNCSSNHIISKMTWLMEIVIFVSEGKMVTSTWQHMPAQNWFQHVQNTLCEV